MPVRARSGVAYTQPVALTDEQPDGRAHADAEPDANHHAEPDPNRHAHRVTHG